MLHDKLKIQNSEFYILNSAFKTSVGSNGRISIPEAERDALGLKEGDLVQVVIIPIEKKIKKRG